MIHALDKRGLHDLTQLIQKDLDASKHLLGRLHGEYLRVRSACVKHDAKIRRVTATRVRRVKKLSMPFLREPLANRLVGEIRDSNGPKKTREDEPKGIKTDPQPRGQVPIASETQIGEVS
ncbi:MAG: hypothetical protein FLDDKLPJ_03657 [Phycisphaerae bacterium]|nr:hypothetical protein [Phycisphaerae bacterium]